MYDVVIIGGGIAGLYTAYRLCRSRKVAVLEESRQWGGRVKPATFAGMGVPVGAGVGRKAKDVRLQALLRELRVPFREFPVTHHVSAGLHCDDLRRTFDSLRAAYTRLLDRARAVREPAPRMTFREFATSVLGRGRYAHFVQCAGYSDFEQAAVQDVLYNYGFEDNMEDWTGLSVPWADVVAALLVRVKAHCKLHRHCAATRITRRRTSEGFSVHTSKGTVVRARTLVLATDIDAIRALVPGNLHYYGHIHGQPFFRMYAAFNGVSAKTMQTAIKGVTVVGGPLQKIIAMSDSVYMIAYSDNEHARTMLAMAKDKDGVTRLLERSLGLPPHALSIDALESFFIPAGTHYNDPGLPARTAPKALQNPEPNVYVVGEAVSQHQGWVEGALESVDSVLDMMEVVP